MHMRDICLRVRSEQCYLEAVPPQCCFSHLSLCNYLKQTQGAECMRPRSMHTLRLFRVSAFVLWQLRFALCLPSFSKADRGVTCR